MPCPASEPSDSWVTEESLILSAQELLRKSKGWKTTKRVTLALDPCFPNLSLSPFQCQVKAWAHPVVTLFCMWIAFYVASGTQRSSLF